MMHYWVGNLGHFFVITSFVTAIAAAFSYFRAAGVKDLSEKNAWVINGRIGYYLHALATIGICVMLFVIISRHYFEYHYAYSHSDKKLSTDYLISTFWNGQEGSFLLWMFWQALLGIVLIHTNKFWEAPVMTVFALVQAFLASMILGVVLPGIAVKIGSSPFILLREVMQDAPIFKTNPNYIPEDGTGLNPLLQNYWMVIHPPTLFLGFATTLVPFSFCIAGLWFKKYREWIRPALPWALFSAAILGLGILMGGYWAYETLNFGGYWNWDPVENGVYVPWLVLVGSIHTMISYKNSETALKASVILAITTFILILYSTFLTRSGVLGDTSVHSFTDLGLSGQLLAYLLFFAVAAIVLAVVRWREIPSSKEEASVYSREFWIFIGVLTLCFMAFQVLIPTSFPVWNQFVGLFGIKSSLAPPGDQIAFYSKFQLWFAIVIATLSGAVQFLWWKKVDLKSWVQQLFIPFVVALLATLIIVNVRKVFDIRYVLMLLTGLFTVCSNAKIVIQLFRTSPGLSGGAVAHIGVGMMLIGVMFSAGYSKIVSLNNTGLQISKDFSDEFNRDNLILFVNEPRTMWGYDIEYMGERLLPRYHAGYIRSSDVGKTIDKDLVISKIDQNLGGVAYKAGDTIGVKGEDTYYEIQLRKNGKTYSLYPRAQINPEMGGMLASPDIYRTVSADLYTHVSSVMNPDEEKEWSPLHEDTVSQGQQFFANDYVTVLESVERVQTVEGVTLRDQDVAVKAHIKIQGEHGEYVAEPIFLIRDKLVAYIPDEITDLGLRFTLLNIRPETNTFIMGVNTRQKDWVIIKAMEKPFINILWIGTLVLMFGFGIAMVRRFREFIKMRAKGQE